MKRWFVLILASLLLAACGDESSPTSPSPSDPKTPPAGFTLTSPAFEKGQSIPEKYCLKGPNVSPPLEWTAPPTGTKGFCLIVDDPDAPSPLHPRPEGPWAHWVRPWIPPEARQLPENAGSRLLTSKKLMGKNDFGHLGYDGPAPPPGSGVHRYVFALYALDKDIRPQLKIGVTKVELLRLIRDHILAKTALTGTFRR